MTLSYPIGIGGGLSDFVTFTPMEYRSQASGGSAPVGAGAQPVTLYMPNSTPTIGNQQQWGSMSGFSGPAGAIARDAAIIGVSAADRLGGKGTTSGYMEQVKTELTALKNNSDVAGA